MHMVSPAAPAYVQTWNGGNSGLLVVPGVSRKNTSVFATSFSGGLELSLVFLLLPPNSPPSRARGLHEHLRLQEAIAGPVDGCDVLAIGAGENHDKAILDHRHQCSKRQACNTDLLLL